MQEGLSNFSENNIQAELECKVLKLIEYADQQDEFTIIYRGEGDHGETSNRSPSGNHFIGTWSTESFQKAQGFQNLASQSSKKSRIIALLVPRSILDQRDFMDKGLQQVIILNPDLRQGAIEVSSEGFAMLKISRSKEYYLNQFQFYRDYVSDQTN
jgi:hypothetical protein